MWNKIKEFFTKTEPHRVDMPSELKSAKDTATANGEPWVSVTSVDVDVDNIGNGSFTLDWNDIFVAKLIRAGYKGKVDADVVDMWFTEICRNVVMETYEQEMADPSKRAEFNQTLGEGRKEFR